MSDRYVVFDLEMPNNDRDRRISSIGITVIEDGQQVDSFYSLVNPETYFDPYVVELTGITQNMVRNKPDFYTLWSQIEPILSGGILVAHGAQYDLLVLAGCIKSYGIVWKSKVRFLCTYELARKAMPDLSGYGLEALCEEFDIKLAHHNALSDCRAAAEILCRIIDSGYDVKGDIREYDMQNCHIEGAPISHGEKRRRHKTKKTQEFVQKLLTDMAGAGRYKQDPGSFPKPSLGIPRPDLVRLSGRLNNDRVSTYYIDNLPHKYHDEDNLHALILSRIKSPAKLRSCILLTEDFLPYLDNAETAMYLDPKVFHIRNDFLDKKLCRWLENENPFAAVFSMHVILEHKIMQKNSRVFLKSVARLNTSDPVLRDARIDFFASALRVNLNVVERFLLSDEDMSEETKRQIIICAMSKKGIYGEVKKRLQREFLL